MHEAIASRPAPVRVQPRTFAERYAAGKALRDKCPRTSHRALERAVRTGKVKAVFEEAK